MKLILVNKENLFSALFCALLVIIYKIDKFDFSLTNFHDRSISIATAENFEIAKRVSLFYNSLASLLLIIIAVFVVLTIIGLYIEKYETKLFNYLSVAGLFLLIFHVYKSDVLESILLVCFLQLNIVFVAILKKLVIKNGAIHHYLFYAYSWVIASILILGVASQLQKWNQKLHIVIPAIAFVIQLLILIFSNRKTQPEATHFFNKLVYFTKPLSVIALIPFLTTELFLILHNRGYAFIHQWHLATIAYAIVLLQLIYRSITSKKYVYSDCSFIQKQITNYFVPFLIAGIYVVCYYEPIINTSTELYELGNPALSVQQYYEYNKLPLFETFNSHVLSELLFNFLYTYLNGYDGTTAFLIYGFINSVLCALISYWLIFKITNNAWIAFFLVVFAPFILVLIPPYFVISALAIFVIDRFLQSASFKNSVLLIASVAVLLLWRLDSGIATVVATVITLLMFFDYKLLNKQIGLNFSIALLLVALIFSAVLLPLAFKSSINITTAITDILAYLNSTQSYGYTQLTNVYDVVFYTQYFIFPLLIVLLVGYCIYKVVRKNKTRTIEITSESNLKFVYITIVYLGVFYVINYHRGLVRHSFVEGWSTALTSFSYVILSSGVYVIARKKSALLKFIMYTSALILLAYNYNFPKDDIENNHYKQLSQRLETYGKSLDAGTSIKIARINTDNDFNAKTFDSIAAFLNENFAKSSTFIDFSNTPMLYFYCHRITPNYFNQHPLTIHNNYLQERYVEDLKKYDVPVVIYSSSPESWWDNVDGIPNTFRHYKMAEYIFANYKPSKIINSKKLWIKNAIQLKSDISKYASDTSAYELKNYNIKYIPYLWGKLDGNYKSNKIQVQQKIQIPTDCIVDTAEIKWKFSEVDKANGNYILVRAELNSYENQEVSLSYGNEEGKKGSFTFTCTSNNGMVADYLIRVSSQYNWWFYSNNWISLKSSNSQLKIIDVSILKGD